MSQVALPALFGVLIWWSSTGLILFLDGLPRWTFRYSMAGATVVLAAALYGIAASAQDVSVTGAYIAFTSAVVIWGWLEASFYMGYVTGPRRHRCAHGCRGWAHFIHAIEASLYHEIASVVLAVAIAALCWGAPNQYGTWTFAVLWWMHQSARLNVFLGVSNLNIELLPDHLDFIKGFFTRKPMNPLFPVSVTVSTVVAVLLAQQAIDPDASEFRGTGHAFLAAMMVLAILEHWFLVLPVSAARAWNGLWQWSLGSRGGSTANPGPNDGPIVKQATIGGHP